MKWPQGRLAAAQAAAVLGCATAFLLQALPGLAERLEGPLLDGQFRLLRALGATDRGPIPEVRVLGIDDASLRELGLPLALLHRPLGEALVRIARARPRAVVLDISLPEHSADAISPGADEALLQGLASAGSAAPLIVVVDIDGAGRLILPHAPLLAAIGGSGSLALGLLARDADGVARRYQPEPGRQTGAAPLPTLEALLAARLGRPDAYARAGWIDYALGPRISYLPLAAVATMPDGALSGALEGRIVLVGSVLAFGDELAQPLSLAGWEALPGALPAGILAHAQAIRSGLGPGLLHPVPLAGQGALVLAFLLPVAARGQRRRLLLCAGLLAASLALETALLAQGLRLALVGAWVGGALALGAVSLLELEAARHAGARVLAMFRGHLSPQVARAKLAAGDRGVQGSARLAILFADLRGFTSWSEHVTSQRALEMLNGWYAAIAPVLHRHGGTIDNFRGDGILVFFGAPAPLERPCEAALAAARGILDVARGMEFPSSREGAPSLRPLRIAIGLAYGDVAYGDLGSEERRDFTAMGDAVNVAARMQEAAREREEVLVMTADFARELPQLPKGLRDLGALPLRGHSAVQACAWSGPDCD
jgi:adenylate cyclase